MAKGKYWNAKTGRYEDFPGVAPEGATNDTISTGLRTASGVMPQGGGMAGGVAGGALSGAGTGAAIGSVVPGIGTAIGAGIGALVGGVGAGVSGAQEDKKQREQMEFITRQQEEEERQNAFNRRATTRNQNLAGLQTLADWRTQSMNNMRGQMFKDDLIRAMAR